MHCISDLIRLFCLLLVDSVYLSLTMSTIFSLFLALLEKCYHAVVSDPPRPLLTEFEYNCIALTVLYKYFPSRPHNAYLLQDLLLKTLLSSRNDLPVEF